MIDTNIKRDFRKLLDVNTPIIYINDFDFARVDAIILDVLGQDANIVEWNPASGRTRFDNKEIKDQCVTLYDFLYSKYIPEIAKERYIILKEIQDYIEDPKVKVMLELMAQRHLYDRQYYTTIIIVSSVDIVPPEVKKYVSYLDVKFPDDSEIDELIESHVKENGYQQFDESSKDVLKLSLRGMSRYDVDRVLDMAMSKDGSLGTGDKDLILKQKEQMVKKSGVVELVPSSESLDSIGGLDDLKDYLRKKSEVAKDWVNASKFGVTMPKGVFIVGMPGCGKSLCAKATANIFDAPLLKLDMGSMMGKYVGQSEENLRNAINIAESAAPCVLWIDEIEKAFSGVGGQDAVLTRMFGHFLSWMQDKKSNVYVVATANNADNLPPELKRKGRFDEIFCVNLPNEEERKSIFKVHIDKLNGKECLKNNPAIDLSALAKETKGFNGADIESVVSEAVERCFLNKEQFSTAILKDIANSTLSISKSCKSQIDSMERIFAESSFRDASTKPNILKSR